MEITYVKTTDKVVTKEAMKDRSLDTSLVERRDTTTSGKIARTIDSVPITKATRAMRMKVDLQGEEMNEKLHTKMITLATS